MNVFLSSLQNHKKRFENLKSSSISLLIKALILVLDESLAWRFVWMKLQCSQEQRNVGIEN